jgi:formylglycine-generating enzyme required for sulfatase activity
MTTAGLLPVKQATMCEGGVPGLFDMSGNAWEWQDDCVEQSTDGTDDACTPLGGSFTSELAASTCIDGAPFFRKHVAGDAGFRCCVDAIFGF